MVQNLDAFDGVVHFRRRVLAGINQFRAMLDDHLSFFSGHSVYSLKNEIDKKKIIGTLIFDGIFLFLYRNFTKREKLFL